MRLPWWLPLLLTIGPTIAREWFATPFNRLINRKDWQWAPATVRLGGHHLLDLVRKLRVTLKLRCGAVDDGGIIQRCDVVEVRNHSACLLLPSLQFLPPFLGFPGSLACQLAGINVSSVESNLVVSRILRANRLPLRIFHGLSTVVVF